MAAWVQPPCAAAAVRATPCSSRPSDPSQDLSLRNLGVSRCIATRNAGISPHCFPHRSDAQEEAVAVFDHLASIAERQHGLVTRSQIRSAGVSAQQLRTLRSRGVLLPIEPRVYAVSGAPPSWEQHLAAKVLAAGPLAIAGARSAAGLWRLDRYRRNHLDLVVPTPAPRRIHGVHLHESNALPNSERTVLEGIPVSTPIRTIFDVARYVSPTRLGAMLDDAVRRDLTTYREAQQRIGELSTRGRNGIATVRAMLKDRPDGSAVPDSPLESDARSLLRRAGIPEPVLHHRVECDELTYVLDLAWPPELVALECDGYRFHRTPEQLDWDDRRRTALGLRGWLVLHVTRRMLSERPGRLVSDVTSALTR
ncbi:MAG: type IV toxin-antitoxin system AbiEi family antitoxin domain-containing protein [Microthrixaceae bacterium]